MEARRRRGMRMLKRGIAQAEVARALEVSRQTASTWARRLADDPQAWRRRPLGRPSGLTAADERKLAKRLVKEAVANGLPTESRTLARVGKLISREYGASYSNVHVMRLLRELGFSCQKPEKRALQRDEAAIAEWKARRWPLLKKARREGRTIVFIDASGLSERPPRVRTWAPKGQTPVLQDGFTWQQLSAIAGMTFWNFYFRLFPGSIKSP
jgi:transposase